jgi:UDP-N-acetylmuramate--alanine ligase
MYRKKAHIHFVGIGGVGMSGIATILAYQGYHISGCDIDVNQKTIVALQELGIPIAQGNNTSLCYQQKSDIIVYSSAINPSNPEILAAQQRGIAIIPRALMLAELMRTKYSVAIAGAHGKTTTTSLISHILIEAGLDPTIIIGGTLKNISCNARLGHGDFLVAEADESDRSLLNLHATLAVVTNIDLEHLETYTDIDDIKNTFKQFLNNIPFYGKAVICVDNDHVRSLLPLPHVQLIKYGISSDDADISATNIILEPDHSIFIVYDSIHKKHIGSVTLSIPGKHNILNALAAIAVARDLGVPFTAITQALRTFKGIERRFSYRGIFNHAELFDDYGHHPQEIICTLTIAKKRTKNKLIVIFQPHRHTRTHKLWNQFIEAFLQSTIDHLIITDIYAAGEQPIDTITSSRLAASILLHNPSFSVIYSPIDHNFQSIQHALAPLVTPNDLILLLGAGKINQLANQLL